MLLDVADDVAAKAHADAGPDQDHIEQEEIPVPAVERREALGRGHPPMALGGQGDHGDRRARSDVCRRANVMVTPRPIHRTAKLYSALSAMAAGACHDRECVAWSPLGLRSVKVSNGATRPSAPTTS